MKKIISSLGTAVTSLLAYAITAATAFAATGLNGSDPTGYKVGIFLSAIIKFIDQILIPLILGLAFLMFVWGVFKFFILGGSDEEAQAKGKSLMLYAVAGFVLILSFYGIVSVLTNGLGFGGNGTLDGAGGITTGFSADNVTTGGHGN